jgi:hypothetical protein
VVWLCRDMTESETQYSHLSLSSWGELDVNAKEGSVESSPYCPRCGLSSQSSVLKADGQQSTHKEASLGALTYWARLSRREKSIKSVIGSVLLIPSLLFL